MSVDADRILTFLYVLANGRLPPWEAPENKSRQIKVISFVTGMDEQQVCAAIAELEDGGLIGQEE